MENLIRMALRLLLSATFLASAYTKAIDFSSFEVRLLDAGVFSWSLTPWVAALFIGLEYLVGLAFLLFSHRIRGLFGLTWTLLLGFSIYLIVLLVTQGNDVNCGCMGETLAFTPIQALVKNALSMLLLAFLQFFEKRSANSTARLPLVLGFMGMAAILTYASIPTMYMRDPVPLESKTYFNHSLLSAHGFAHMNPAPKTNGKVLYAFLSMSCGHCQVAAERIGSITQKSQLPIRLVINGDSTELAAFLNEHEIDELPVQMLGAEPFLALAGNHLPALLVVENDSISHRLQLFSLNGALLENLLR